jgi:hypothetical protein
VEYALPPTWTGNFTSFSFGGASTDGLGIDNDNDVIGTYFDSGGVDHALLLTNNVLVTTFQINGSEPTFAEGINDFGQVVGSYKDSNGNSHGFLATFR